MFAWGKNIQELVQEVDRCIRAQEDEGLTLRHLAQKLGYSEYHVSHMFRRVSGMQLRDYLRGTAAGLCPAGRAGHGGQPAHHRSALWLFLP